MKNIAAASPVKVSADGHGVVSQAGMGMLRELADRTGLSAQVTAALADTYRGPWVYAPGEVFADLAAAVADGADCIDAVGQLCGDREHVLGAKASTTTMWRLIDERIDAAHLPGVRAARAAARAAAWAVGAAPTTGGWLHIDIDATLVHRCETMDVHPSGPLWGRGDSPAQGDALEVERAVTAAEPQLCALLAGEGLEHERRALRLPVRDLNWSLDGDELTLEFELTRGAFATAVLHEIVQDAWAAPEGASD